MLSHAYYHVQTQLRQLEAASAAGVYPAPHEEYSVPATVASIIELSSANRDATVLLQANAGFMASMLAHYTDGWDDPAVPIARVEPWLRLVQHTARRWRRVLTGTGVGGVALLAGAGAAPAQPHTGAGWEALLTALLRLHDVASARADPARAPAPLPALHTRPPVSVVPVVELDVVVDCSSVAACLLDVENDDSDEEENPAGANARAGAAGGTGRLGPDPVLLMGAVTAPGPRALTPEFHWRAARALQSELSMSTYQQVTSLPKPDRTDTTSTTTTTESSAAAVESNAQAPTPLRRDVTHYGEMEAQKMSKHNPGKTSHVIKRAVAYFDAAEVKAAEEAGDPMNVHRHIDTVSLKTTKGIFFNDVKQIAEHVRGRRPVCAGS